MREETDSEREVLVRSTIVRYFDAIGSLDEEGWLGIHAPDAVVFAPVGGPPTDSREELRLVFRGLWDEFAEVRIEPDRVWPALDGAAVKWTARATGCNGRQAIFEGIDVFEIDDDGRIRTVWSYWDPSDVSRELRA